MSKELFVYEWVLDPDKDTTNIRIYGISPGPDGINRNICLRVENFKPYAYIQLPDKSDDTARAVIDHLQCIESPPVRVEVLKKHHLYNFENKKNKRTPFMFAAFKSKKHIQDMVFHLKHGINILGETMKLKVHETSASPILQMVSLRDIPMSGWIDFSRQCPEPVPEDEKMTVCDEEYVIKWKNLDRSARVDQVVPKCMAFDMEVNSDFMNQMPSDRPGDCIFQISCVITEKGRPRRKILLSLKAKDMELAESELLAGVEVRVFDDEKDLLADFMNLIAVEKPNALTGFNIFGFDIEYAMKRAVRFFLVDDFKLIGFNKHIPARIEEVKWSSSAYKNQVFKFINWEGILLLDLLPIIRRDYKLDTYTLKNVTAAFLNNNTKDPVTYKDIFIACRTREKLDMVGKYCVQDSDLCIELMNHLHTWVALSEMAKVCNVSMFTLYTQGQQIKMYSQVYKFCLKKNIVVDNDGYEARSNERYRGAHVIEPDPGFYERVVPVDFCLTGDTKITLANGMSKRLDAMTEGEMVLGCESERIKPYRHINGLQVKGERETVKILLRDGREVIATPDHKFMLDDGTFCEAQDLRGKKVLCGVTGVLDDATEDDRLWTLHTDGQTLTMTTEEERGRTLAFCRILGYVLADGSLYANIKNGNRRLMSEAYFGTMYDANVFVEDIIRVTHDMTNKTNRPIKIPTPRQRDGSKGTFIIVTVPAVITNMLGALEGMVIGKRSTQDMDLPHFLSNAPICVVREFLAALFGGDGTAPHLSKERLCLMSFKWDTVYEHVSAMTRTMETLQEMIIRVAGIAPTVGPPTIVKSPIFQSADKKQRMSVQLTFPVDSEDVFEENVGFRYCINKSNRLMAAASYTRLKMKIRSQKGTIFARANELVSTNISHTLARNGKMTMTECLQKSINETQVIDQAAVFIERQFLSMRGELVRNPNRPKKSQLRNFKTFKQYLEEINALDWFAKSVKEKVYSVTTSDETTPCMTLEVVDITPNGLQPVYDIEVDTARNFLANGVVAHNCSLYPSLIIAYNICPSTITDETTSDDQCNIFAWEDHVGCEHDPKEIKIKALSDKIDDIGKELSALRTKRDEIKASTVPKGTTVKDAKAKIQLKIDEKVDLQKPYREKRQELKKTTLADREDEDGNKISGVVCAKRYYRFLKPEVKKGVIPTIIQSLLDSRKRVKDLMKKCEDNSQKVVYDKEQLAYKVSANSMYGAMGVKRGYLPFMPGAMCVTFAGRTALEKTAELIQSKFQGTLVYGDTDSNYVTFPHIKSISETWDYAIKVADGVTNWTENGKRVFPHPIKLEFENTIYERFLILSKKRYMYQEIDRDGNLNRKVGKKGVILARRDNSQVVRSVYEKVTAMIFDRKTRDDLYIHVDDYVRDIYDNKLDHKDYVITKSVGDSDGSVDNETGRVGDYKVKELPRDPKERAKVLNGQSEKEYYVSCMPAQVQLAERMKRRGVPVNAGSRIEYVVTRKPGAVTLGQKIEDYDYFKRHTSVLELDPKYYVEAMINPLDQIFKTMGYGDMMKQLSVKWDKSAKEREEAKRPILVVVRK
jgi:DNA polymerase elongation subunit (family B)